MRRIRQIFVPTVLLLAGTFGAAADARAQLTFPQTLMWGTGLVDIPVASVAPLSGDFAINYSGRNFQNGRWALGPQVSFDGGVKPQLILSASMFGRAELGFAAYSTNPEYGFFGRAMVLREDDLEFFGGLARFVPSLAVGVRNIGPYSNIDRFGIGYGLFPPNDGTPNYKHIPDPLHTQFNTNGTVYGVATKTFSLRSFVPTLPNVDFGLTVGYGNGLFKDDGRLGPQYSSHATGGLFYGVNTEFAPARNFTLTLMAENNAWDYNAGASLNYRGIRAGAYLTEIGAGSSSGSSNTPAGPNGNPALVPSALYNYQKVAFTLGWQSNIFALIQGNFLANQVAALERRRNDLLAQIALRQQRIAALELEINKYEAQNLLELEQSRAKAEAELRSERESLQRLEERLRRVEQQTPGAPPPPPPPASPPPQSQPQSQPAPQAPPAPQVPPARPPLR
ncbi:MAG: hypothetical protein NVS9B3_10920 [Gemmatimonadaceae bacterium]